MKIKVLAIAALMTSFAIFNQAFAGIAAFFGDEYYVCTSVKEAKNARHASQFEHHAFKAKSTAEALKHDKCKASECLLKGRFNGSLELKADRTNNKACPRSIPA